MVILLEYRGIDVSELQGKISWKNVSATGKVKFAMIRATYGSSGIDSQFVSNINDISGTGIYPGAYHQSEAQNVSEAEKEANHFLNVIRPYNFSYPLALSIESEVAMQTGKEFFTDIILSFLNTIKEAGYRPLLRVNKDMLTNNINVDRISDIDIWLSEPAANVSEGPSYKNNVKMWRYSDGGYVSGISGRVGMDISYVDYPLIIKNKNINDLKNGYDSETQNYVLNNADSDFSEPTFYTVEKGETLRSISQKILGDADQYRKLMELNGLTRPVIFAGQILRIPPALNSDTISYRVEEGDTLWKLAERFLGYGPRYEEIMRESGLTNDMIYPGQILKIPVENSNDFSTYIVKKGDNLWKISKKFLGNGNRYTEIMRVNNLKNGTLRVGQPLIIPQK